MMITCAEIEKILTKSTKRYYNYYADDKSYNAGTECYINGCANLRHKGNVLCNVHRRIFHNFYNIKGCNPWVQFTLFVADASNINYLIERTSEW
jgi:hypothetical protein